MAVVIHLAFSFQESLKTRKSKPPDPIGPGAPSHYDWGKRGQPRGWSVPHPAMECRSVSHAELPARMDVLADISARRLSRANGEFDEPRSGERITMAH